MAGNTPLLADEHARTLPPTEEASAEAVGDPRAIAAAQEIAKLTADAKKETSKNKRGALAENVLREKLEEFKRNANEEKLDWDDESVFTYALSEVESIFNKTHTDLPEELIRSKEEWMDKFIDRYIYELKKTCVNDYVGLFDLKESDVRSARDATLLEVGNFEVWLKKNYPKKFQLFEKKEAEKKEEEKKNVEIQKAENAFEKSNSGRKDSLRKEIDELGRHIENYPGLATSLNNIKDIITEAKTVEDIDAAEAQIKPYKNEELTATLTRIHTGLTTFNDRIKKIDDALHITDFAAAELETLQGMAHTFDDPTKITVLTAAFEQLDTRITGAERITVLMETSPIPMDEASIAAIAQELSTDDGTPEVLTELEKRIKGSIKTANDQIEAAVNESEMSFADTVKKMADGMQDGGIKSLFVWAASMMHSIGGMITGLGIPGVGNWAKNTFFTAEERLSSGDPSIEAGRNAKRHMFFFGLPKDLVTLFVDKKAREVYDVCTNKNKRKKLDEDNAYGDQLDQFALQLNMQATKVNGGKDKTIRELFGDKNLKLQYRPIGGYKKTLPPPTPPSSPTTPIPEVPAALPKQALPVPAPTPVPATSVPPGTAPPPSPVN